jgi:TPR repeat protein
LRAVTERREFYLNAIKQEDPNADGVIGVLYTEGIDLPHDRLQAYRWFAR